MGPQGFNGNDAALRIRYERYDAEAGPLSAHWSTQRCPADYPVIVSGGCGDFGGGDAWRVTYSGPLPGTSDTWKCAVHNGAITKRYYSTFTLCAKATAANVAPN